MELALDASCCTEPGSEGICRPDGWIRLAGDQEMGETEDSQKDDQWADERERSACMYPLPTKTILYADEQTRDSQTARK
jgi:hypothetical protein